MKKSIFFYALTILIIISCAKTELVNNNEEVLSKSETIDFNDIDESTINPLAREYFENVVTTMFVTGILENTKNSDDNPFLEKLENFDIELEDGSNGSIYDLNLNEKEAFINKWAIIESYEMSQRISQDKVIEFDVLTQNKIVSKALEMSGVTQVTKSSIGAPQINSAELFKYIREGYEEFAKIAEEEADLFISSIEPTTRYSSSVKDDVDPKAFQLGLYRYAKRGDLLVSLANNEKSWYIISYSEKYKNWKFGHSGIMNMTLSHSNYPGSTKFAIATNRNGVTTESFDWWNIRTYVMGLRKEKWTWSWRKGLTKSYTNLTNAQMQKIANYAERFYGVPYCLDATFAIAKLVAPKKFTCTTLLWYSIKKTHGIDVSAWWNPLLVTPSDIYNSSNTYVKTELR